MKFVLPFVVLTAGFAGVYLIGSGRSVTSTPRPVALDAVPICADDNARLTAQVEALQREVAALKSQASRDTQPNARPSRDVASTDSEGGRAAEAERHHVYMTGVAQAFSAEKIDFGWAGLCLIARGRDARGR